MSGFHDGPRSAPLQDLQDGGFIIHEGGRPDATQLLERRIADPEAIEAIKRTAFRYSDFMALGLYHEKGYFQQKVDYSETMPLLPKLMSPVFGVAVAELAFAMYRGAAAPSFPTPTFLSLGAGRGYLDADLINHVTSRAFLENPEGGTHADKFGKDSRFLVTDIGENALNLARQQLEDVEERVPGRVTVERQDATSVELPKSSFGVVYCNELFDNLPTEPVVDIDGEMHVVRVQPYLKSREVIDDAEGSLDLVRSQVPEAQNVITSDVAREMIDQGRAREIGFIPLFIPASEDPQVAEMLGKYDASDVNGSNHNGVYPMQVGLEGMFRGIKRSFDHGIFIGIDYVVNGDQQNWNRAFGMFGNYKFGNSDIDFRIDPKLVEQIAVRQGFKAHPRLPLDGVLKACMWGASPREWAKANRERVRDISNPQTTAAQMSMDYSGAMNFAPNYEVMLLTF